MQGIRRDQFIRLQQKLWVQKASMVGHIGIVILMVQQVVIDSLRQKFISERQI
jgi:hypothetical protein